MDGLAGLDNELEIARRDLSAPIGVLPKRIIDIALALSGIILLAPLLVICYLLTIATSSGPVLFRHRRVGFNGKHFDCLKFRTMLVDAPERLHHLLESDPMAAREWAETRKLRRDPRITAIGAVLRKSSLDELPQLFNVLKGDMSIVGPRPITDEELERYTASGMTSALGWPAQNSRMALVGAISWFALPQIGLLPCTQPKTLPPMQRHATARAGSTLAFFCALS